jgi:uncharacterized repeat protein (TIGR03803 family)
MTVLSWFDLANGAYPDSGLTLGRDGSFYGTTYKGGDLKANRGIGFGTVFKVTTNGVLGTLASFNRVNGAHPYTGLAVGRDGSLYGTTNAGGTRDQGTVFRIASSGVLTSLASFGGENGTQPNALTLGNDGDLYGTTRYGGANQSGTVFKVALSAGAPHDAGKNP